jgi:hypothetical protein
MYNMNQNCYSLPFRVILSITKQEHHSHLARPNISSAVVKPCTGTLTLTLTPDPVLPLVEHGRGGGRTLCVAAHSPCRGGNRWPARRVEDEEGTEEGDQGAEEAEELGVATGPAQYIGVGTNFFYIFYFNLQIYTTILKFTKTIYHHRRGPWQLPAKRHGVRRLRLTVVLHGG